MPSANLFRGLEVCNEGGVRYEVDFKAAIVLCPCFGNGHFGAFATDWHGGSAAKSNGALRGNRNGDSHVHGGERRH